MSKLDFLRNIYRSNASKAHKNLGELFETTEYFANMRIYQEYPVERVYPYYNSGREKFDWVILDLQVVCELHGEQHYRPVRFGGITQEEADQRFEDQKIRDAAKKRATWAAGFSYVCFRYDEKITLESFFDKLAVATAEVPDTNASDQIMVIRKDNTSSQIRIDVDRKRKESEKHKAYLQKQKEYRKKRYQLWKEKRDGNSK